MNKTLKTFLRSTADTGSGPEAMMMFLPQQKEANIRATVDDDSVDAHGR
jgi:hypothetical protein